MRCLAFHSTVICMRNMGLMSQKTIMYLCTLPRTLNKTVYLYAYATRCASGVAVIKDLKKGLIANEIWRLKIERFNDMQLCFYIVCYKLGGWSFLTDLKSPQETATVFNTSNDQSSRLMIYPSCFCRCNHGLLSQSNYGLRYYNMFDFNKYKW